MKTLKKDLDAINRLTERGVRPAEDFFSDFQQATLELKTVSRNSPLASRLVTAGANRNLQEKTGAYSNN